MKNISSDTYTIAWFKLAECVARGEKERAFGVYRLLAHSLDDDALAVQLEGDLLLAFSVKAKALERYEKAAHLYHQSGKLLQEASVYEHAHFLDKINKVYLEKLFSLYSALQFYTRVRDLSSELIKIYSKNGQFDEIRALSTVIMQLDSFIAQVDCFEHMIQDLFVLLHTPEYVLHFYIEQALKSHLAHNDSSRLQLFMTRIQAHSRSSYEYALTVLRA